MLCFALPSHIVTVRARNVRLRRHPHMCESTDRPAPRTDEDRAKDFLTQRAVQHTMFCSRVLRDETTVRWLEDWLGHHGLDDLHHCDALKVSSTEYLTRLMKEPSVVLEIKKPIPGRTTRKNPYIERRYFTYDVEIVPRKLGLRILEARKQIAEELITDIPYITYQNSKLLELYRSRLLSNDPAPLNNDIHNLPPNADLGGSPYRIANFDLVKNYTLYLGLCAAVRELSGRSKGKEDAEWLSLFFSKKGKDLIRPYGGARGNADAVIETLLRTPPSIREGTGSFLDPSVLAERVLRLRAESATLWLQVMKGAEQEMLDLKRQLLEEEM